MLNVCFEAWDKQPSGYVFICSKENGAWRDYPFKYPDQKKEITEKYESLTNCDVYWSLLTFSRAKRREEYAQKSPVLFADLDPVPPQSLEIRPSVAWRSSKERYQCIWYLSQSLEPEELKTYNRNLTYHIGADKGGWDLTQVLRIPGSKNYKYNPAHQGKVLWNTKKTYKLSEVKVDPPKTTGDTVSGNFVALLSKYRKVIPQKVSRMLQYPQERIEVGRRSEILWYLESELVKAKIPLQDIVVLIANSAWNKYKGRSDELKRITTEIEKIYQGSLEDAESSTSTSEDYDEDEENTSLPIVGFASFMGSVASKPGWMVKDIWLRQSHGIIAGDPKTFKSTIALDIAVSVASGRKLWGQYEVEDQGPVLIIQNENSDWIVRDRMERIMASKDLVGSVQNSGKNRFNIEFAPELPIAFLNNYGYNFGDPLHREQLEKILADIRPALVMFDPLYLMFDGELNSARELNPILQWLLELKNVYKCSIMLIHHWNKNGSSSRGGQRMLGSVALHGWTESGLFIQAKEAKESEVKDGVGNVVMEREFRAAGLLPKLALEIDCSKGCHGIKLSTAPQGSLSDDILKLLLQEEEMSVNAIAKALGISRDKVARTVEGDPIFELKTSGSGKPSSVRIKN